MKTNTRRYNRRLLMFTLLLFLSSFGGLCGTFRPAYNPKYPYVTQPLRQETKDYFCNKLGLTSDHPICQSNRDVFAADLVPLLEERFPVNQTPYSEVAEVLRGYPVDAQESKMPDGTVTSRTYAYLLTEYDGFCVYFGIHDVQADMVSRIYTSSVSGSGPTRTTCMPSEILEQPRPWLSGTK
jgi:hypothetical protein